MIPHRKRYRDNRVFLAPISVYHDVYMQYWIHIRADIGKKTDIGGGKKRVNRYIGHDIGSNIEKTPIKGQIFTISEMATYVICIRYRVQYRQYRTRYRDQKHDIVISYAAIGPVSGFANIGFRRNPIFQYWVALYRIQYRIRYRSRYRVIFGNRHRDR